MFARPAVRFERPGSADDMAKFFADNSASSGLTLTPGVGGGPTGHVHALLVHRLPFFRALRADSQPFDLAPDCLVLADADWKAVANLTSFLFYGSIPVMTLKRRDELEGILNCLGVNGLSRNHDSSTCPASTCPTSTCPTSTSVPSTAGGQIPQAGVTVAGSGAAAEQSAERPADPAVVKSARLMLEGMAELTATGASVEEMRKAMDALLGLEVSFDVFRANTYVKAFHRQMKSLQELCRHEGELGQLAKELYVRWRDVSRPRPAPSSPSLTSPSPLPDQQSAPQAKTSRQHVRKKTCAVCGEKVHLKGMPRHMAEMHQDGKTTSYGMQQPVMLACVPPCYFTFKRKSQLKEHQKGSRCIRNKVKCNNCDMWLTAGKQQKNHLTDRKCSGQFGCLFCPTTFKTERGCKQHIVEEHSEEEQPM